MARSCRRAPVRQRMSWFSSVRAGRVPCIVHPCELGHGCGRSSSMSRTRRRRTGARRRDRAALRNRPRDGRLRPGDLARSHGRSRVLSDGSRSPSNLFARQIMTLEEPAYDARQRPVADLLRKTLRDRRQREIRLLSNPAKDHACVGIDPVRAHLAPHACPVRDGLSGAIAPPSAPRKIHNFEPGRGPSAGSTRLNGIHDAAAKTERALAIRAGLLQQPQL